MFIAKTQIKHFRLPLYPLIAIISILTLKNAVLAIQNEIGEIFCVHDCHLSGVDKTRSLKFINTDLSNL